MSAAALADKRLKMDGGGAYSDIITVSGTTLRLHARVKARDAHLVWSGAYLSKQLNTFSKAWK